MRGSTNMQKNIFLKTLVHIIPLIISLLTIRLFCFDSPLNSVLSIIGFILIMITVHSYKDSTIPVVLGMASLVYMICGFSIYVMEFDPIKYIEAAPISLLVGFTAETLY
jgi:hypothetical protein